MADIFDEIGGDVFDSISGDVFDQITLPDEPTFGGGLGGEFRGHGVGGSWAPETLGEKIKSVGILDVLAHLPFSPLHDYEKKGAEAAKAKLRKGTGYGPNRVRTMGGVGFPSYQTPRGPQTVASLSKIVETQEEKEARGETTPAAIAGGIADLPGYMGEMYAGGIGKIKSVPGALGFAGKMTAMQPARIESAMADQIERGETGGMALAKAWGDVYIENISEAAGAGFGKIISKLPFGGKLMEGMRKFAKSKGVSDSKFWKTVGTKVGYNGILGEWGEERLGTYLRGLIGTQDFGAGKDATMDERIAAGFAQDFQTRSMLIEAGVLLTPGAAKLAGKQVFGRRDTDSDQAVKIPLSSNVYETAEGQPPVIPGRGANVWRGTESKKIYPELTDEDILNRRPDGNRGRMITPEEREAAQVTEYVQTPEGKQVVAKDTGEILGMAQDKVRGTNESEGDYLSRTGGIQPTPAEAKGVISNTEVARQYGLNDKEAYIRLSEAEQQFQELNQKKTTDRSIAEEEELRFLKDSRTNLEALLEWDTTPVKERVGKQRQKPYKSQYAAGHQIPKILDMSEKDRRAFMKKSTGETSMAKMTPSKAQQYIDDLHEYARKKKVDVGILPTERKFRKPVPVFGTLTPQVIKRKILGIEFMVKPSVIGKKNLDSEFSREARQVDKMERVINTLGKETMATKAAVKLKNVPTKSVAKFAELVNEHEEAPDWLTDKEKDVFNYFRGLNRAIIARENEVRAKLGIEPIPYKTGYMRHNIDVMAQEMMDNKYPIPEELKYWTEKNTTMKINNPMEYQRKLGDELADIFSKDLIKATKSMLWTGLKEIHLSEPLKFFENQMGLHSEVIPASTRRWAENFIKHMVKGEQTNTDRELNDLVKESGIGKVIDKVLKPFGRKLSHKPVTNLLGTVGRINTYGVMGPVPKQLTRNKFQWVQNTCFSTLKNCMKGFASTKQCDKIISESQFMRGYLEGSGFEELMEKRQGRGGRLWMAGYRRTALGNASRAMKIVYRDRLELVENSKYKKFGWADPQRTYTEEKGFLYPSEKVKIADEMDFCAGAAQYSYMAIDAPEIFKYRALTPFTRLQSWWMNHFFMFHREGASRFFTGKTREGLRLPWSRRLGWGCYMLLGGVILNTLGYSSSYLWGAAPDSFPPLGTLIINMYLYAMADRDQDRARAKYKAFSALKTFIPGYIAAKNWEAFFASDGDWTKLLFYNKGIFKEEPKKKSKKGRL